MRAQIGFVLRLFRNFAHLQNAEAACIARQTSRFTYCCEITIEELDLSFRGFHVWRHLTVHLHLHSTSTSQRPATGRTRCQPVRKTMLNDETMAES